MKLSLILLAMAGAFFVCSWAAAQAASGDTFAGIWYGITSGFLLFATAAALCCAALARADEQED